ncbi:helix-turn-helix domain-containing protein [Bacillus sp. OK048]|uniref:helix-turn-helix domain-containing protein n=1 Tax=Bacillus sp. OK048 TaxID=1882761 RepID=UPI000886CF25|nr:helix-turn-helix domain-containing protein [Bacillus sp. OK048]SDM43549.1 transcriptional regulator, AraC family [Bacillus sp. OK048]
MRFKNISEKLKTLRWRGSFHRNSFILILLIASIPGLITGLSIYWFAVGKVEDELRILHTSQIEQRAKNIDEQFKYLEYSTSHWAFEPRFGESLKDIDFVKQFTETYDISKTLLLLQGSHNLIKEVDLYIEGEKPILFNSEYNVLDDPSKTFYHESLKKGKKLYWEEYPVEAGTKKKTLAFVHSIPATSKHPFGSIIVTIDHNKALQLLKTLTPYDKGATFILDGEKEILLSSNSTNDASFINVLKTEMGIHKQTEGSFQIKHNKKMYSISYGQFTRIDSDWTYVSAAPMSSITAPLILVSRLILIFSISALILAFILSWFTSNRLYSPINKLLKNLGHEDEGLWRRKGRDVFTVIEQQMQSLSQKSDLLQSRLVEQVAQIKSSFILQLIQGYLYHHTEEDLRLRMESYGWELEGKYFTALEIQLTGLGESMDSFSNSDESLITFTASNIMEELAHEMFGQFNILTNTDLSVGVLVIHLDSHSVRGELHLFAEKVTKTINEILNMQVTVTISEPTESIKRIPYIFEEVRSGKRFRLFENSNQVIDLMEHERLGNFNQIHYPFAIEKEIIQAIRMGHTAEVEHLIRPFLQELTEKGINEINIHQGIVQLYSSIQHEILHSGIHPHELFEGKNMYEELSQIRDTERIIKWFTHHVVGPFIKKLEGRMNIELKRVIEKVVTKIQESYDDDISLESCADEVGTNPYSLSKAFKQMVGINFIDYLTQLRIEKAKELLINSDMKINDIAEGVGYRHSYFNRIFKKQIGVPPSQYRKLNQIDNQMNLENDGGSF